MSIPLTKIILYTDIEDAYLRRVWTLPEGYRKNYSVGKNQPSIPKEATLEINNQINFEEALFNEQMHCRINEELEEFAAVHLEIKPGKYLSSVYVIPDNITTDLFVNKERMLVYEFYNPSKACTLTATLTKADDKNSIAQKILNNPDDLEYRQYFLRKSLKIPGIGKLDEPQKVYPEWMTQEEVAEYTRNTVKNVVKKTSAGIFPVHKGIGTPLYKKSEIDKAIQEN